jgi:thiosulfate/3-mercaptopyruvate sulfurtransferase
MQKHSKLMIVISMTIITTLLISNFVYAKTCYGYLKDMKPIVSTNWLYSNLESEKIVVLDVRTEDEYNEGHIKNSINIPFEVPFSSWITMRDDLLLELPSDEELFNVLGEYGITSVSKIVVITSLPAEGDEPYTLANATRVADTLIYAGVKDVSILDGGITKWINEGKTIITDSTEITPVTYESDVKDDMFVSIDYVYNKIGSATIVDARDTEVYLGEITEEWADKAGHIPTAVSMPAPSLWDDGGEYLNKCALYNLVSSKVGTNIYDEIIVYCGVGGYASSVWYTLSEVLGYKNVKIFDGSAQEWSLYYDMEL